MGHLEIKSAKHRRRARPPSCQKPFAYATIGVKPGFDSVAGPNPGGTPGAAYAPGF
jgi:hypothetical protein